MMPFSWIVWRFAWGLNGGDEGLAGWRHIIWNLHFREAREREARR